MTERAHIPVDNKEAESECPLGWILGYVGVSETEKAPAQRERSPSKLFDLHASMGASRTRQNLLAPHGEFPSPRCNNHSSNFWVSSLPRLNQTWSEPERQVQIQNQGVLARLLGSLEIAFRGLFALWKSSHFSRPVSPRPEQHRESGKILVTALAKSKRWKGKKKKKLTEFLLRAKKRTWGEVSPQTLPEAPDCTAEGRVEP